MRRKDGSQPALDRIRLLADLETAPDDGTPLIRACPQRRPGSLATPVSRR
jgi:hypothetical protein